MAPSVASSSTLTRHRPTIFAVTGAVALLAAYVIYQNTRDAAPADLHRSNAVRRRRRNRTTRVPEERIREITDRLEDTARVYNIVHTFGGDFPLGPGSIPTEDDVRQVAVSNGYQPSDEEVARTVRQLHTELIRTCTTNLTQEELCDPRVLRVMMVTWTLRGISRELILEQLGRLVDNPAPILTFADRFMPMEGFNDDDNRSLAGTEMDWSAGPPPPAQINRDQELQRLLYHIAEDRATNEGVIHHGVQCDGCDKKPIRGVRWRCANCADFDLCSDCEATTIHDKTHIFFKIRVPAPQLGQPRQVLPTPYPGRPHLMPMSIPQPLKKALKEETQIEQEEIDGLWHQFTCLANTPWPEDPRGIGYAIDRNAFDKAIIPHFGHVITAPNLVYDRIFALLDANRDNKIGFEEFIKGINKLHSRNREVTLRLAFDGYDVDENGYISRQDVLRLFRAYYAIEQEATKDHLIARDGDITDALDRLNGSQPLASGLEISNMRESRDRFLEDKQLDRFGDPQVSPGQVVRDSTEDRTDRNEFLDAMAERPENYNQSVQSRWERREFYVDEEEGFRLDDMHEDSHEANGHDSDLGYHHAQEHPHSALMEHDVSQESSMRPRPSRSSSRVRFQDDVDEIRSNASTSSRPVGERWGGYDIPVPEQDLFTDIFYQVTQEGLNELLDGLFRHKEDLALAVTQRKKHMRKLGGTVDTSKLHRRSSSLPKATLDLELRLAKALGLKEFKRRYEERLQQRLNAAVEKVRTGSMETESPENYWDYCVAGIDADDLGFEGELPMVTVQSTVVVDLMKWRADVTRRLKPTFVDDVRKAAAERAKRKDGVLESDIVNKPLDELLAESGYQVVHDETGESSSAAPESQRTVRINGTSSSTLENGESPQDGEAQTPETAYDEVPASAPEADTEPTVDPTLPQHRPNSLPVCANTPISQHPDSIEESGSTSEATSPDMITSTPPEVTELVSPADYLAARADIASLLPPISPSYLSPSDDSDDDASSDASSSDDSSSSTDSIPAEWPDYLRTAYHVLRARARAEWTRLELGQLPNFAEFWAAKRKGSEPGELEQQLLDAVEKEIEIRGGPGRISWEEFRDFLLGGAAGGGAAGETSWADRDQAENARRLRGLLEGWLECVSL